MSVVRPGVGRPGDGNEDIGSQWKVPLPSKDWQGGQEETKLVMKARVMMRLRPNGRMGAKGARWMQWNGVFGRKVTCPGCQPQIFTCPLLW